jgi:2-octaprenyl-6-methoxyphenol hydroxylase
MNTLSFEAVVVGGGPAGLTAALALARAGRATALVDPTADALPPAGRTTAVMAPQADFLRTLGVWPAAAEEAPLRGLRIVNRGDGDDEEILFLADELDLDAFAWNVPNAALVERLRDAAAGAGVTTLPARLAEVERRRGDWRLTLDDGRRLKATLMVGADGKTSRVREALKIPARRHDYGQLANTAKLAITGDHDNVSTEIHKAGGPFTTVPAGTGHVSLVWLEPAAVGDRLADLDDAGFLDACMVEDRGRHGRMVGVEGRAAVPVVGLLAERLAGPGAVILGEAAHAVSPLGAQGFNLSLRDAAALGELAAGAGFAKAEQLCRYERDRLTETRLVFWFVDALNRSVQRPEAALRLLSGVGLQAVSAWAPVRRAVMARLLQPHLFTRTTRPR